MAQQIRLGDLASYINGYAFKPSDRGDKGLPIIRIQDLTGNSYDLGFYDGDYPKKIEIKNGDVLISWSASLGVYIWNQGKALLNQHIFKVVFDKAPVNKDYFVFAVKYNLNKMAGMTHGATMKHIVKKDFDNILVPYPSLDDQEKIAEILSRIQRMILNKKSQIELLDTLIKSRFVELFGDPDSDNKYPQIAIKDFTNVVSGGTPDRNNNEYWDDGTVPWVKTTELQNNRIVIVEESITEKGLSESSAKMVPKDTVLIAMYGQGKTRGMTAILGIPASTNQACACILPSEKVAPEYLWHYMIISYDRLRNLAQGGNQPNLNGNMIKNFTVLMPPKEMQIDFVNFVKQVDKSKVAVQKALDEAQLLFDSLMQHYFG